MRLRSIVEDKEFFDYTDMSRDMWREKIHDAQDEQGISFDLENDDDITDRTIKIDQDQWDTTDCKFNCQLCAAGGDWQQPVYYFRCQLSSGYAFDLSRNSHFIYIPGKNEGNPGLQKTTKGSKATWIAPDSDDDVSEPEERKCWESLKKHLKDLVDKEVKEVKKGRI